MSRAERRKVGQRSCIVCGSKRPKQELLRLVLDSEGRVCLDRQQRYHGRGGYVCSRPECLARLKLAHLQKTFRQALPETAWNPAWSITEALLGFGAQPEELLQQPETSWFIGDC